MKGESPKPRPVIKSASAQALRKTELVLRELDTLPTLPSVATRLLQLGSSDKAEIKEIVRLIEADPTLTIRLLAMCKRGSTRTRHPISTVELAVVMLGLDAVRSLVLSVQVFEWTTRLKRRTTPGAGSSSLASSGAVRGGFDRVGFWHHSVAVACACELLCRAHGGAGSGKPEAFAFSPEEAFVAGLIHDLGKLALELVLPKAYARVIELSAQRGSSIASVERAVLGLDHADAGARLASRWGLSQALIDAIGHHHAGAGEVSASHAHARLIALVSASDALCRRLSLGWSGSSDEGPEVAQACLRAGLDPALAETVIPGLYEATSARCKDLGLGEEPSQQLLIDSILGANARLASLNTQLQEANAELRATQEALAESQSLARLGQMTAGAAHEMNNPLTVISGRAQTILARARDDRDRSSAQAIVEASQRLTGLIARLNRIASPPMPDRQPIDLTLTLGECVRRAKARCAIAAQGRGEQPALIGVKVHVPEGLPAAWFDPDLLIEALVEVVVNALESSPKSGIEVRAERGTENDRLSIVVTDDGVGMDEEARSHALDPFYSHKPAGRQSGLGLALAHRLLRLQDGDIQLQSQPGKGTIACASFTRWRADQAKTDQFRTDPARRQERVDEGVHAFGADRQAA